MYDTRVILLTIVVKLIVVSESSPSPERTKLNFFYGPSYYDSRIYDYNELDDILLDPRFDLNKTTALYIHGYKQTLNADDIHAIVDAYNTRNEQNLIVYDWSQEAGGDYLINAIPNAVALGNIMGTVVLNAIRKGLDVQKFHVVGHSLGAQLAGYMARTIIESSNHAVKLQRITGLDPANPGFFPALLLQHLSYCDAEFVDIIHSDAGLYGQPIPTGTVDFWPNGGKTLQPGCPFRLGIPLSKNDLCSHQRSVFYYAEGVKSPAETTFLAISAKNWRDFIENNVNISSVEYMGIDCSPRAFGNYYLQTDAKPQFSRDINGIRYVN